MKTVFELILISMIFLRTVFECYFTGHGIFNSLFIASSLYYINSFYVPYIVLKKYVKENEKKIWILINGFFLIPLFMPFFLRFFPEKRLTLLYVDGLADFFKAFFSLLILSDIHPLLKIEAVIIIPGIFFFLIGYKKFSIKKAFFIAFIIYSWLIFIGITQIFIVIFREALILDILAIVFLYIYFIEAEYKRRIFYLINFIIFLIISLSYFGLISYGHFFTLGILIVPLILKFRKTQNYSCVLFFYGIITYIFNLIIRIIG